MRLSTTRKFDASAEQLWPLLFHSKMDDRQKEKIARRVSIETEHGNFYKQGILIKPAHVITGF